MKKFKLKRSYLFDKTIGILTDGNLELVALELPWKGNKVNVSCIPPGKYIVKRDKYGRHQWYSVQDVDSRTFIEFHIANTVADLLGCIGLGLSFTFGYNLADSKKACEKLLDYVGDESFELEILTNDPTVQ